MGRPMPVAGLPLLLFLLIVCTGSSDVLLLDAGDIPEEEGDFSETLRTKSQTQTRGVNSFLMSEDALYYF